MMPDTSAADVFAWIGTALGAAVAAWGLRHGAKDKGKSATAMSPELAGLSMGLIDASIQRGIAADTKRTADGVDTIAGLLKEQVELQEELREKQEADKVRERLDKADDDRTAMAKKAADDQIALLKMIAEVKAEIAKKRQPGG